MGGLSPRLSTKTKTADIKLKDMLIDLRSVKRQMELSEEFDVSGSITAPVRFQFRSQSSDRGIRSLKNGADDRAAAVERRIHF
jgi:hypothetical protein